MTEGSNTLSVIYGVTGDNGLTAVSGIQQDLNVFTSFSCNEATLTPGLRVNYIPTTCGSPTRRRPRRRQLQPRPRPRDCDANGYRYSHGDCNGHSHSHADSNCDCAAEAYANAQAASDTAAPTVGSLIGPVKPSYVGTRE